MSRLLKLVAIPAVILGASLFATPKANAHWGYGYGYSHYHPTYTYTYYTPTYYPSYYSYPSYNYGGHCW